MSDETSPGITVKLPRRVLPFIGAFLLGGGGGLAGGWFGLKPQEAAAALPTNVARQLDDLNRQREQAARERAVLQEQVQSGFAAVRADLADLRSEIRDLRRRQR